MASGHGQKGGPIGSSFPLRPRTRYDACRNLSSTHGLTALLRNMTVGLRAGISLMQKAVRVVRCRGRALDIHVISRGHDRSGIVSSQNTELPAQLSMYSAPEILIQMHPRELPIPRGTHEAPAFRGLVRPHALSRVYRAHMTEKEAYVVRADASESPYTRACEARQGSADLRQVPDR